MSNDPVLLTKNLLRCPSVTPHEGGALDVLGAALQHTGFHVERITFSEAGTPDIDNLYARIGTKPPYLLFAGHTDVVPVGDAARWTHDPFAADVSNGVLFGRGAVDMKGAIACFAAATMDYLRDTPDFNGSIGFLVTGDEEGPSINGTVKLIEWAHQKGERFDLCLVGEPSNRQSLGDTIKIGRRGSLSAIIRVEGQQGHVAYPHLADNPVPRLLALAAALTARPLDIGTAFFDASNLEIIGLEAGAGAFNVIPAHASLRLNVRFNDTWTQESLEAHLRARMDATGVVYHFERVRGGSDAFYVPPGAFVDLVKQAVEQVTGVEPTLSTGGGTSDARFIKNYCPVLEFGLVGQTMHMVDERVAIEDLTQLTLIYGHILRRFFQPHAG